MSLCVLTPAPLVVHLQETDPELRSLLETLRAGRCVRDLGLQPEGWERRRWVILADLLSQNAQGELVIASTGLGSNIRPVLACPSDLRVSKLDEAHQKAHLGFSHLLVRLRLDWYWPGMARDVRHAVQRCTRCSQAPHEASAALRVAERRQRQREAAAGHTGNSEPILRAVGDSVWLKSYDLRDQKLAIQWDGPYLVHAVLGDFYRLTRAGEFSLQHRKRVRLCRVGHTRAQH